MCLPSYNGDHRLTKTTQFDVQQTLRTVDGLKIRTRHDSLSTRDTCIVLMITVQVNEGSFSVFLFRLFWNRTVGVGEVHWRQSLMDRASSCHPLSVPNRQAWLRALSLFCLQINFSFSSYCTLVGNECCYELYACVQKTGSV